MRHVPEAGSETTTSRTEEKRKVDATEHSDPIDLSAKRQLVSPDHSMSQILRTLPRLPAYFDDSDAPCTLYSDVPDDSSDSDCSGDFG